MTRALLLAVLALHGSQVQAPPTFGSGVEVVHLDVFVTQDGEPVRGLRADNFVVLDNGVRQEVRLVALEDVASSVVLVFDTSGSVAGRGLQDLKEAGEVVLDGLRRSDRAALITFADSPHLRIGSTRDLPRVRRQLGAVQAGGRTALYDGIYAGLALPTDGLQPLVVVFTDGADTASWLTPEQVLDEAWASRAVVQVVTLERSRGILDPAFGRINRRSAFPGVSGGNPAFASLVARDAGRLRWLKDVADRTGGLYWSAESTGRLKATFAQILEDMADRYVLAFEPKGVALEGVHELQVTLEGAKGQVRARERYVIR
jgi:VWFA-related protein